MEDHERAATALSIKKLLLLVSLTLAPQGALAANFTVTKTADTSDGVCDNDCSLREAIVATNANTGVDQISFAPGDGSAQTYTLTITGTDANATQGDLNVEGNLTLLGNGPDKTIIDGGDIDRVFFIEPGVQVSFSGLTIQNGTAGGNFAAGGGLFNFGGTVTIDQCSLTSNNAEQGGAIYNTDYGILPEGVGSLTVTRSTLSSNVAVTAGGGIFHDSSGTVTLTNSTLSGNSATDSGGGLDSAGTVNLNNVTMTLNSVDGATHSGGGIHHTAGTLSLKNSLVAGNLNLNGAVGPDCAGAGAVTSQGYNVIGVVDNNCNYTTGIGDQKGIAAAPLDAKLGALADNGGKTLTHSLLANSPAIDSGNPAGCNDPDNIPLALDQRGFFRPWDGDGDTTIRCDSGAFEFTQCGDGALQSNQGETCDDGNQTAGDGCAPGCQKEDLDNDSHFPTSVGGDDCNDGDSTVFGGATEGCDGKDNDCDGSVDEDIAPITTTCGVGVCAATGTLTCQGGALVNSCAPKTAGTEICDGLDNDCDGTADEDIVATATTCGVGACAATGTNSCVGGKPVDSCTAGTATTETCDGLDNDCDGTADEDIAATATACGIGACATTGSKTCQSGKLVDSCAPFAAGTETCGDGIDQDCNGEDLACPVTTTGQETPDTTEESDANTDSTTDTTTEASGGCTLIPYNS